MSLQLYKMFRKNLLAATVLLTASVANAQPCTPVAGVNAPCTNGTYNIRLNAVSTSGGITNINNTNNACVSPGYIEYNGAGNIVKQNAGSTFNMTITAATNASPFPNNFYYRFVVWVDWDHNDTFNNAFYNILSTPNGEQMAISPTSMGSGVTLTTSTSYPTYSPIYVPLSAKNGLARMRVRVGTKAGTTPVSTPSFPDPCAGVDFLYGEVEDYWVDVVNPCLPPASSKTINITDKSAVFTYTRRLNAAFYEYYVSKSNVTPGSGNIYTKDTALYFPNDQVKIECNTKYYVFVRSICDTGKGGLPMANWDVSGWKVDSFTTAQCCYTPEASVNYITSTTAIASWTPVPSVVKYEYSILAGYLPPTPSSGILTTSTSVLLRGLSPMTDYTFFVRAICTPTPYSDWKAVTFLTQPNTGISTVNATSGFELVAFPNPVKDMVTLYLNKGMRTGTPHITVTDLTGKVIDQLDINTYEMNIDLANKPAGIYIIKYQDEANSQVLKITKE